MTIRKGFASMDPERVKEIASQGGKAAAASGKAHRFTSAEARAAGQKGGRVVSCRPGHMSEIGRRGGTAVAGDREHMRLIGHVGGSVSTSSEPPRLRRVS